MKKKIVVLLLVLTVVAGSASAQIAFSVGGGGYLGGDFGGGVKAKVSEGNASATATMENPYFGAGGYVFFDATYAELSFGLYGGGGQGKTSIAASSGVRNSEVFDMSIMNMNIALLGKYPVAVSSQLSVFPLLGIDFQATLSAKNETDSIGMDDYYGLGISQSDFSALWFKFGGGLDYAFTSHIFLRFEALYGIRLPNQAETKTKNILDSRGGVTVDPLIGHGLTARVAIGYRF